MCHQTCQNSLTLEAPLDIPTGCYQVTSLRLRPLVLPETSPRGSGRSAPQQLCLQYVDLTDCQALEDGGIKALVRGCPQLTHLFLRRCLRITDGAVKCIASYCVMLRELSISDCLQVRVYPLLLRGDTGLVLPKMMKNGSF